MTVLDVYAPHPTTRAKQLQKEFATVGMTYRAPDIGLTRKIQQEMHEARAVLVPSDTVRKSLVEEGVSGDRIRVVPFGVNTHRFVPPSCPRGATEKFDVLFVGAISVEKGLRTLLEGFRRFVDLSPGIKARLMLVGRVRGNARVLLRRHAGEFEIAGIRRHDELVKLYQGADVLVLPSHSEGSALVTYEAMACGLPVITTPEAGSIVRDGEDGYLVEAGAPEMLADRLASMCKLRERTLRMGQKALQSIQSYRAADYGGRVMDAYRSFLGGR
jgi:glycosyltransferase involved in cell wall biosynthesis